MAAAGPSVVECSTGLRCDAGVSEVLHRCTCHPIGMIDHRYRQAASVSVIGVSETDDPGTDDNDVVFFGHIRHP